MNRPLSDAQRKEIQMRIKNKVDISDIIDNAIIKGEDLTGAIISRFNRTGDDISGVNLAYAVIGTDNGETHLSRAIAKNCCFKFTRFLGKVVAKKTNFSGTSFEGAFIPVCDYRFADMRNCTFCGATFVFSTSYSYGAKFSPEFFKDLGKHFNLKIEVLPDIQEEEV